MSSTTIKNQVLAQTSTPLAPVRTVTKEALKLVSTVSYYPPLELKLQKYMTKDQRLVYRLHSKQLMYDMVISKAQGTSEFYRLIRAHSTALEFLKQSTNSLESLQIMYQDRLNELADSMTRSNFLSAQVLSLKRQLTTLELSSAKNVSNEILITQLQQQNDQLKQQNNQLLNCKKSDEMAIKQLNQKNKSLKNLLRSAKISATKQRNAKEIAVAALKSTNDAIAALTAMFDN
jgi:hypothetical protein